MLRTWARLAQTPVLGTRTRHRRRVSAIGGLRLSPRRWRISWHLRLHTDKSIRQPQVIQFLAGLLRRIRGPVIVLWDHLQAHKGEQISAWLARNRRLHLEYLPGYAPELNPQEYGWSSCKRGEHLANYCPDDVQDLHKAAYKAGKAVERRAELLEGFLRASHLPIKLRLK